MQFTARNAATRDSQPGAKQDGQDARLPFAGVSSTRWKKGRTKFEREQSRENWTRSRAGDKQRTRKDRRGRGHIVRRALLWEQKQEEQKKINEANKRGETAEQDTARSRLGHGGLQLALKVLNRAYMAALRKSLIMVWHANLEAYQKDCESNKQGT